MKEQLNSGKQNSIDFFTNNELKERKLSVTDTQNSKERFAHALLTPDDLLGEVQVTGCGHGVETLTPESILIAFKMDPQFDKDPKYPNQYQKAKTDKNGNIVLESPKHYLGFAGYAKITKLQGAVDKLFVEYHVIYDEPFEWFNGTTSLVSKLTINFTQSIRKFRRNILKYEQEHPSPGGSAPATQAALQSTANKP